MWYIYLLWNSEHKRTYIGITKNLKKRLRQHNGEIKGGAKATSPYAPHWEIHCSLYGFQTKSIVMRWEKIIKIRFRGLDPRRTAFIKVSKGICPGSGKKYPVPENITYEWY